MRRTLGLFAFAILVAAVTMSLLPLPAWTGRSSPAVVKSPLPVATATPVVLSGPVVPLPNAAATQCATALPDDRTIRRADEILDGTLHLGPHDPVPLGAEPDWEGYGAQEPNWHFQFHALRWTDALKLAWDATGDDRYLERYRDLLRSWHEHNPVRGPDPEAQRAWQHHATAFRAMRYACAAEVLPTEAWLTDAVLLHANVLADPDFGVRHGNHALNQATGLLSVACVARQRPLVDLALQRLATLVEETVDDQGVAAEQAVEYQYYDWGRFTAARERITACDQPVPAVFERVDRMPEFLAHATMPDGRLVQFGDSELRVAQPIPGTIAEYTASAGATGPLPMSTVRVFTDGWVFARSGWGVDREFTDESHLAARFGGPRRLHGHFDAGSLVFHADGRQLIQGTGKYRYIDHPHRSYVVSRDAQNVVVADRPFDTAATAPLLFFDATDDHVLFAVGQSLHAGVRGQRRVLYLPEHDIVVVDDRFSADGETTWSQLWRLPPESSPVLDGAQVMVDGEPVIQQLRPVEDARLAEGEDARWPSWTSPHYGEILPSPRLVSTVRDSQARFITVIGGDVEPIDVPDVNEPQGSISFEIDQGASRHRVDWSGRQVSVEEIDPGPGS